MKSTGKDKEQQREKNHHGQFHGLFLGPLAAFHPHCLGLDPQDPANVNAVGVGRYGLDKAPQLGDAGPLSQRLIGLAAVAAYLHVLQGSDQLVSERSLAVFAGQGHPPRRSPVPPPQRSASGPGVGQFQLHRLLALHALAIKEQVRDEVAEQERNRPASFMMGVLPTAVM